MPDHFKILNQGTLGTTAATMYSPSAVEAVIGKIVLRNTDVSNRTFELWINGNDDAHQLHKGNIDANCGATGKGPITLAAGETLQGKASAGSAIRFIVMGMETV